MGHVSYRHSRCLINHLGYIMCFKHVGRQKKKTLRSKTFIFEFLEKKIVTDFTQKVYSRSVKGDSELRECTTAAG